MAEDLKIRVRVEPNPTGLQTKLDEIGKKYKLNVQLFDDKAINKQISDMQNKLEALFKTTARRVTDMAETARSSQDGIAAGVKSLVENYGDAAKVQEEISKNAKGLSLFDKDEISKSEKIIEDLTKELKEAQNEENELKKKFVTSILSGEKFDKDNLAESFKNDLAEMESVAGKSADVIKDKINSIFNPFNDSVNIGLVDFVDGLFASLDGDFENFKNDYEELDEIIWKMNAAADDPEEYGFKIKQLGPVTAMLKELKNVTKEINNAKESISNGINVEGNLKKLIELEKKFYDVSGFLTNGIGNYDRVAAIKADIEKEQAKIDAIIKKANESVTKSAGNNAETAGTKAGTKFAQAAGNVIVKQLGESLTLDSLINKTFNIDDVLNNVIEKADKDSIVRSYKDNIITPLNNIVNETKRIFNLDITGLDEEIGKPISEIQSRASRIQETMGKIGDIFYKVKDGNLNDGDFENLINHLRTLQDCIGTIKDIYNDVPSADLGQIADSAVTDDAMNAKISKLEESMRRLVQLQISLTYEKKNTLVAEEAIIAKSKELTDVMKKQQEVSSGLIGNSGKNAKSSDSDSSKEMSEAVTNAGKVKESLKEVAATVKELNTNGLTKVLKTVQKFVETICSDGSKVDAVQQKISEFNIKMGGFESAIDAYTKAVANLNTYFAQSATILEALGHTEVPGDNKKASAKNTETGQQVAAKMTVLLNKVGDSSDKVITAVHDAGDALTGIAKEMTAAAEISGTIRQDGQTVLNAIAKLREIFDQYEKALTDVTTATTKAEGGENASTKTTTEKKKTQKSASAKDVPLDSDTSDKLKDAANNINKVLAKYKSVAKNTEDFAEKANKLISAGTKISAVINKFNDISELSPNGLKIKVDTGSTQTDSGKSTNNIESAAQEIKDGAEKINNAADKSENAATKNETAANQNVKKSNVLTVDTANRTYKKLTAQSEEANAFYKNNDLENNNESAKTAYKNLETAIKNAGQAKEAFDNAGSSEALTAYRIALRDLEDAFNEFDGILDKVRDGIKSTETEMSNLGKSMNARYNNINNDYAVVQSKLNTARGKGYKDLINDTLIGNAKKAAEELDEAKKAFAGNKTSENADKYQKALTAMNVAVKELKQNLVSAERYVDNAFKSIPDRIAQTEKTIATLKELKARTSDDGKVAEIDALIKKFEGLDTALKNIKADSNYTELESIFAGFGSDGEDTGIKIKSLTALFDALNIKVRQTTSSVRILNTQMRDFRNVESWQKSMQNTLYTANRYFNNNSKISENVEAYSKFFDFFSTYNKKIENEEFTQDNAVQMSKDWSELKRYIQDTGLETDKLSVKLKKLFEVNIKSQLANQVINAVQQGLRQMYQNVVDIDTAMTELKKVTDETSGTYDKFLSNAGERAKSLGVSVSDIVNATSDFARLGYNLEEATQVSNAAVLFKQVGDGVQSMDDATSDIISAMKAFNITAEDSTQITDKFNEVGNNFAITSAGIAEALKRSASSLSTAGNDIDQSIGMIVAANDVVQDPESVGAGLRVISLRIRGATTELESMGEEIDGVATSTAKLQADIKALSGVNIMEADNKTFKSTYQILDELAGKWKDLTDIQQASITEKLAGKNRANIFSSMMNNWQDAQDAMNASKGSIGSATEELDTYLDSIEGKLQKFQATFQSFSSDLLDSDLIKFFIDIGTAALDAADNIVKMGDALPAVATALTGILSITNIDAGVDMPFYAGGIAA